MGNLFIYFIEKMMRFGLVTPGFTIASIILLGLVWLRLLVGGTARHYGDQQLGVLRGRHCYARRATR